MTQCRIMWDTNYGVDKRTGWSMSIDGVVLVQFKRFLIVTLVLGWWRHLKQKGNP